MDRVMAARNFFICVLASGILGATGCTRNAEEYYRSAVEYCDSGQVDACIIELKNALQREPELTAARELLGTQYLLSGDYASAAKELERALQSEPSAEHQNR